MKNKKYWLSPEISWKTYQLLHDKTGVRDLGPVPKHFDKILWELLRDRKINIYITSQPVEGDTWFPTTSKMPKNSLVITSI